MSVPSRIVARGAAAGGARVRTLRAVRGWTLEQAAEAGNLDWRQIQRLEAGKLNPTLGTLARLADGFGLCLGELVAEPTHRAYRVEVQRVEGYALRDTMRPAPTPTPPVPAKPDEVCRALGQRVQTLRKARGWTQNDLASRADLALQHLQRVEQGRQNATTKVLVRIANALGVGVADLFVPA